jgi:hypothetical protein
MTITILDQGREAEVDGAIRDGRPVLPADALEAALGFTRKPEGLCKGEICIPVRPGTGLEADGGFDLSVLAKALGRPLAVDEEAGAAHLGAPAAERAEALRATQAPDFTLPDLDGRLHSLSDHRGRKVLLAAYASW